ncbi:MAG: hypothetical protein WBB28_14580 [Crinalium sp.]
MTNNQLLITENLLGDGMASNYVSLCDSNWGFIDKKDKDRLPRHNNFNPPTGEMRATGCGVGPVCLLPYMTHNPDADLAW